MVPPKKQKRKTDEKDDEIAALRQELQATKQREAAATRKKTNDQRRTGVATSRAQVPLHPTSSRRSRQLVRWDGMQLFIDLLHMLFRILFVIIFH